MEDLSFWNIRCSSSMAYRREHFFAYPIQTITLVSAFRLPFHYDWLTNLIYRKSLNGPTRQQAGFFFCGLRERWWIKIAKKNISKSYQEVQTAICLFLIPIVCVIKQITTYAFGVFFFLLCAIFVLRRRLSFEELCKMEKNKLEIITYSTFGSISKVLFV